MHDLVRLHARQQSDQHAGGDGRDQAITRLLDWYLDMTGAADAHLRALPGTPVPAQFAGRDDALAWLDAERPALTAAVTLAASAGRDQAAMRLPIRLAEYLSWRRRFDDWITATTASLAAARRLGDRANEAAALTILGSALGEVRRFDEAITAHQDAAAIFRRTGDRHREGTALNNLGLALREVLRFDEAITAFQADIAICQETGDRHGEGITLNNLGGVLRDAGRGQEAVTALRDAAAAFRETGDPDREHRALQGLEETQRGQPG